MKYHEIKLNHDFCDAVLHGEKTFEVRSNDRDYQKGDRIKFVPISRGGTYKVCHAISEKEYEITYVLNGWGLENGYVALAIKEVKKAPARPIMEKGDQQ